MWFYFSQSRFTVRQLLEDIAKRATKSEQEEQILIPDSVLSTALAMPIRIETFNLVVVFRMVDRKYSRNAGLLLRTTNGQRKQVKKPIWLQSTGNKSAAASSSTIYSITHAIRLQPNYQSLQSDQDRSVFYRLTNKYRCTWAAEFAEFASSNVQWICFIIAHGLNVAHL